MDQLTCPICQSNMAHGRAAVRKNIAAKMNWPFSSDRLFFMPNDGESKSETVALEGRAFEAYKCERCGTFAAKGGYCTLGVWK